MCTSLVAKGYKSRKENPQKLTQLSSRSHPRHLVGKKTAQKDTIIDIIYKSILFLTYSYVRNSKENLDPRLAKMIYVTSVCP